MEEKVGLDSGWQVRGEALGAGSVDKRILVISQFGCPPLKGGARARMGALLREMHHLGYEVHFAGIRMSAQEKAETQPMVDKWVWDFEPNALHAAPLPNPWRASLRKARTFLHQLRLKAREPLRRRYWLEDLLDQEFRLHWLDEAGELQRRRHYIRVMLTNVVYTRFFEAFPDPCLRIVDTIDMLSHRRRRLVAQGVRGLARSLSPEDERRGLLRAHRVIAIQAREAAIFSQMLGTRTQVYTIGHFAELQTSILTAGRVARVGCLSAYNLISENGVRWFLREVWPKVKEKVPTAEFWMAGSLCAHLQPEPGVRLVGPVDSVEDFYRDCPVVINPVQVGTGLKIKTIEALMHNRPVVTTDAGGEGLDEFLGHGMIIVNSAEEFITQLVRLLSDLPAAHQLGLTARTRVQAYLDANRRAFAEILRP